MPALSAYGPNPWAGVNPNNDQGWGGYQWPAGVPARLLGTARYAGRGSVASCQCRVELVELFELVWEIADKVHNYTVFGSPNPTNERTWGPWGYENRSIGGGSTASNHSRGKAMDINAPRNAQGTVFRSDMPVGMVRDITSLGFYWGGWYTSLVDAMHFEFILPPDQVPAMIAKAKAILGRGAGGDWFDGATVADLRDVMVEALR